MASSSRRISELKNYTNVQFASGWQSAVIPANYFTDIPDFPDTYKVPISSVALNFKDGAFSGHLTVLGTLSANAPVFYGTTTNRTITFVTRGVSNSSSTSTTLEPTDRTSSMVLPIGKSWFFKVFIIGVSNQTSRKSTNIEFTGLIRRDDAPAPNDAISIVGIPTKIIHSREDLTTDATIEANSITKKLDIKVRGGGVGGETYGWTSRVDLVQF
jgi:hypothetical protein